MASVSRQVTSRRHLHTGCRVAQIALAGALLAFAASVAVLASVPAPAPRTDGSPRLYDSIVIRQPASNSTIFDNEGNVEVAVKVSPALRDGDEIALALDGHRTAKQGGSHFRLSGIPRGEHVVLARVVDSNGNALVESAPVTFYVWHASRLFPNRKKG